MIITGIPAQHIISRVAKANRDYTLDFLDTDSSRQKSYPLKVYLRYHQDQYVIKLSFPVNSLDMKWVFEDDEYELASRVFHQICDEVDYIKTHYMSGAPLDTVSDKLQESVCPISASHQEEKVPKTVLNDSKDYKLCFANSETNNDIYTLQVFLRHNKDDQYKVRLALISGILAYPALEVLWKFSEKEYEVASRTFYRVCDEVDLVKTDFEKSMMPAPTIAAKLREAVRPISLRYKEKTHILSVDEAAKLPGVSDWRMSIYRGQYPQMTKEEKMTEIKFQGNNGEKTTTRKSYSTREKYGYNNKPNK